MLIQLQKVPLVPHEFLKLSHKLVEPRPLNLVLLQILLPQWTVSEIVILKCKQKKKKKKRTEEGPFHKSWGEELTVPFLKVLDTQFGMPENSKKRKCCSES